MNQEQTKQFYKFVWDICGHENIVEFLKNALVSNNLSHAYIFSGPENLGKYTIAEKLALSLFCSSSENRPCGECSGCHQVFNNTHPDFFLINRLVDEKTGKLKREIIIDQIRELKYHLSQFPLFGGYKVAIIRGADDLNINSANSLLKLLEEPSKRTIIILIVKDIDNLPQTIVSRCQVLQFLPVATNKISAYLQNKGASVERAESLARLALGRPGLAINWLVNYKEVDDLRQQLDNFYSLLNKDLATRLQYFNKLIDFSNDESLNLLKIKELLNIWQIALRDLLLINYKNERLLANFIPMTIQVASVMDWQRIIKIYQQINQCRELINSGVNSKNILENLLIQI